MTEFFCFFLKQTKMLVLFLEKVDKSVCFWEQAKEKMNLGRHRTSIFEAAASGKEKAADHEPKGKQRHDRKFFWAVQKRTTVSASISKTLNTNIWRSWMTTATAG
ncbi:MAG: hypothetical protein MRZ98_09550 [Clostridiales bacterium]|nr:hypothetical protein [Clostridiales bacterium]